MINVVVGSLSDQGVEGLVCPIRSDLAPLTVGARDLLALAGEAVTERLRQMGVLPVGGAFITPAGGLEASFLIHVVTAAEDEPESPMSVQRGLRNALRRAAEWGLTSLALPALGLGAGRLEVEDAALAVVELLVNHLDEGQPPLDLTVVVAGEYEAGVFRHLVEARTGDRFPLRN